jgi:hypothetical protein
MNMRSEVAFGYMTEVRAGVGRTVLNGEFDLACTSDAGNSQNKPDESQTGRPTFIEDFLLEHSHFGQQADSRVFTGYF